MTSLWRPFHFTALSLLALPTMAQVPDSAQIEEFLQMTPAEVSAEIEAHFHEMRRSEERITDPLSGNEYLFVRLSDISSPRAWEFSRSIDLRLMEAHHLSLKGNHERAAELIREVQLMDPDAVDVKLALAGVLWDQGDTQGALELLRGLSLDNPDNVDVQMELGLRLQESNQSPMAIIPLRRALDLRPENHRIQQALAQALIESGKLEESIEILQNLVNTEPGNLYGILLLANAADRIGETEIAIDSYERLIKARPDIWSSYQALANIYRSQGDLDLALESLGRALLIEPEQPEINASIRTLLRNEGGADAVLDFWSDFAAEHPDDFDLQTALIRRLVNGGQTERAQEALEEMVERAPNDPAPRRLYGAHLLALGEVDAAMDQLRTAHGLDRTDEDTIDMLIDVYIEREQIDEARALVAESTSPLRRARNHSRLAEVFAERGEWDLAEQQHRAAIAINPTNPVIRVEHLNTLVERGDMDLGLEATLETIEDIGLNPQIVGRSVPLYHMVNQFKSAIDDDNRTHVESVLEEAVSAEPTSGALRALAIFHHEWGNPERALDLLSQAWDIDNNPAARLRVVRILLSQGAFDVAEQRLNELQDEGLDTVEFAIWQGIQRWLVGEKESAHERWREALERSRSFEVATEAARSIHAEGWDELGYDFVMQCIQDLGIFHTTEMGDVVNVYSLTTWYQDQIDAHRDEVEEILLNTMGDEPTGMDIAMLAQFHSEGGDTEQAERLFLQAASMQSSEEDWKPLIAQIARDHGHLGVSEAIYRDAIAESEVPNALLMASLGETVAVQERTDEAAELLREAREADDSQQWTIFMAELTRDLNMTELSEEFLLDAISEDPDNDSLYYQLGYTRDVGDRHEEAEEAFRQAIELNPDNYFALNHLGYMFTELGTNLDEALNLIERAVAISDHAEELHTGNAFIVDSLGWAHHMLGNHDQAIEWLREAIRRADRVGVADGVFLDHLGDALMAAGRDTEAVTAWTQAISLFETSGENENIVNVGVKIIEIRPDSAEILESVGRAQEALELEK